ncbi:Serine/threonine-protein kinase PknK [Cupriavidus necator]|uniref:Serine/threonine-protein kinase PknK n=1 Tax=Cupriavidus necator TaxID=106590 RepID=A0A1K0J1T4_CUPNE|nr:Serine/threonine-protein kinase PknK [Cupriavidus necator]
MAENESSLNAPAPLDRAIEAVASTKLVPPRAARRLMPRDALQARLLDARRQRCVLVQGPAGCGKTSTLVAWRQALLSLDFDVAWLSVAAEDNELTRFFACLLASIAVVDPRAVREAALLLGRDSSDTVYEHCVITVVEALACRTRELVLVIDDAQLLDDAGICQVLQWLLDYAPPNLHLAIGTRTPPRLSLSRLRMQGQLSEFDLKDLRFTPQESERFLCQHLGRIDRHDAQVLHQLTDGWVAGLQLFAVDLQAKRGAGYARVQVRDATAFASYFEREVLVNLPADDLELLTRAAICNRFCASLCATLMRQPHAVAGMTSRLARLDAGNLFISQVSGLDQESWYRVHPLLREILMAHQAALPEADRRALHGAAWRWFALRGHLDEAVRHAVLAGEAQAAGDVVEACAVDLMGQGELVQLASLVRRLPADQVQGRFALRLVTAYLHMYARDLGALEVSLRQLEAGQDTMSTRERFAVRLLRGALAMQRDDTAALRAIQPELAAIPEDAPAFAFAGRAHLLAWMHMYEGEYALARAVLRDGAQHNMAPARRLVGQALEGMGLALEGRMAEAEHVQREVLQACALHGAAYVDVAGLAEGLLGELLYESNALESVCRLLEPRLDLLERTAVPDAALRAMVALAGAHWALGRQLAAHDHLDRLEDYGGRHGLDRPLAHALALRLRIALARGETSSAMVLLERIEALGLRHAGASAGIGAEIRRVCEASRARALLHWRDFDGAVACLKPLLERTLALGQWSGVATMHLSLGLAHAGRGDQGAARTHVVEALRLGHRLGLVRSLLDVSTDGPVLLESLLAEAGPEPVLAFYARRLLDFAASAGSPATAHTEAPAVATLNERERQILSLVAQAMPNKKIARALGVTPHTVKWHLRNIYSKLGVSERDEAVARMRDVALGGTWRRPE